MKERKSERKQSGAVRKSTTYGTKIFEKISENNIEGREEKKKMKKRKKLQTYEKILIWSGLTKKKSLMKSLSQTIPNKERKSL